MPNICLKKVVSYCLKIRFFPATKQFRERPPTVHQVFYIKKNHIDNFFLHFVYILKERLLKISELLYRDTYKISKNGSKCKKNMATIIKVDKVLIS